MNSKQQLGAIGLDVGGTKIAAGVVLWPSGEILHRTVIPTKPKRGGEAVLKDSLDLVQQLNDWARGESIEVAGIGAGVAELVDCDGNVTSSCTIDWSGRPVQQKLSEIAPAQVESDVRAASNGDKDAIEILTSAGEALGVSTAFLVNVLDPEVIVVGGGLGTAGGLYWNSFERSCREHIFADNSRRLPIVTAKLGVDAGL